MLEKFPPVSPVIPGIGSIPSSQKLVALYWIARRSPPVAPDGIKNKPFFLFGLFTIAAIDLMDSISSTWLIKIDLARSTLTISKCLLSEILPCLGIILC